MLFNIENDSGDRVIGYIVPESFGEIPEIELLSGDRTILQMQANEIREALVGAGRHQTGQCGFNIGTDIVPDLPDLADLRIVERNSQVTIYRRPRLLQINKKILRFETSFYPFWRLDNQIAPNFQYFEKGLERHGRETVTQMFLLNHYSSILLSGRIFYKNFAMYIDDIFDCFCVLQDPHEELVERLLVLAKIAQIGAHYLGDRDASRLAPAIAFAAKLDFEDSKSLRKHLNDIPIDVAHLLANPLVRQFNATTPDEMPVGHAVASTLDVLAGFVAVGTRDRSDDFCEAMGAALGIDPDPLPRSETFGKVRQYADLVRSLRLADILIEKDLEVFYYLNNALKAT